MQKRNNLKNHLKKGNIYRRAELQKWSTAIDRHLAELTGEGTLRKVGPGLYHFPKKNAFGAESPKDEQLIGKFLDDDNFLITSYNHFNALGLGTTQLYNSQIVYNHLRTGDIKLGGKTFSFCKKSAFPKKQSKEFLMVELLNNLEQLAEYQPRILEKALKKAKGLDQPVLQQHLEKYGNTKTRKILQQITK